MDHVQETQYSYTYVVSAPIFQNKKSRSLIQWIQITH